MERQSAKIKRSYPVQYSGAITGAPVAALSLSRQSPTSDPVIKHPVPESLSVRGSKAMFDTCVCTPSQQTEFSVTAVQISTLLFTAFIKITYRIRPQAGFVKGINPVTVRLAELLLNPVTVQCVALDILKRSVIIVFGITVLFKTVYFKTIFKEESIMPNTTSLLANFRRIIKLYDTMLKPVCGHYDLTQIEATIISFLYNNPGKDTAADIVELRMLSKGNVSRAVESLIQKSLLTRRQDTADRRRVHLSLTPDTRPITKEIETVRQNFRQCIFAGFTPEEQEQFHLFNERIAENTKKTSKEAEQS